MYLKQREGWIEVITGPMYAGKTEELIRRVKRLEYAKQNIIVFKPQIDNRYALDEVVSHNNLSNNIFSLTRTKIKARRDNKTLTVTCEELEIKNAP